MIQFMLIAAPRSATTWAANWLTTERATCLHDPLLQWKREELDAIATSKRLGISCTGIGLFPDWINAHPARKIILHRDLSEIDASLASIGMTACSKQWAGRLGEIGGIHIPWRHLFNVETAKWIYEYLLEEPFDAERWAVLKDMNVQANFGSISINRKATANLMRELRVH